MSSAHIVDGKLWKPYSISFTTQEGEFSFEIYALSMEHASYILEDIKRTGKLDGELLET